MPGLSGALQIQCDWAGRGWLHCGILALSSWDATAVTHRNDRDLLTHLCWIVDSARLLPLPSWKLLRTVEKSSSISWGSYLVVTHFICWKETGISGNINPWMKMLKFKIWECNLCDWIYICLKVMAFPLSDIEGKYLSFEHLLIYNKGVNGSSFTKSTSQQQHGNTLAKC